MVPPPWPMASRAFTAILTIASSSSLRSTRTGQTSGRIVVTYLTVPPSRLLRIGRAASITSLRCTTVGLRLCRREKESSWRVRVAPRCAASSMASAACCPFGSLASRCLISGM